MIDDIYWFFTRTMYEILVPFRVVHIDGHTLKDVERGIVTNYYGRRVKYLGNNKFYCYD